MLLTERVWYLGEGEEIWFRPSDLRIDPDDVILDENDSRRAITVESGLQARDFAVYARFRNPYNGVDEDDGLGLFVTQVNPDSSGILVHGESMLEDPRSWSNERFINFWRLIAEVDPSIYSSFGIESLADYIALLNMRSRKGQ